MTPSTPASTSTPARVDPAARADSVTHVFGRSAFARRARTVRRTSRWWKGGVAALLVVAVVLVWLAYWGPVLVVKTVVVQGASRSATTEVRAAADVPAGRQLARIDLAAVERRVDAVRAVASASVTRSWPSTVTVRVTMRRPVAVVTDGHGVMHLADRTGTAYAEVSSAPKDLPQVTADASDPAAVQAVISVLGVIPANLRAEIGSASARTADDVRLTIGRATVSWGSAEDSELKARDLAALRKDYPDARRYDLSAPNAPAVG